MLGSTCHRLVIRYAVRLNPRCTGSNRIARSLRMACLRDVASFACEVIVIQFELISLKTIACSIACSSNVLLRSLNTRILLRLVAFMDHIWFDYSVRRWRDIAALLGTTEFIGIGLWIITHNVKRSIRKFFPFIIDNYNSH